MATVALSGIITPTNVVTAASTTTLTNKTISGASNTLTNIPLTTGVTGTLPIANGGTGTTSTTFVNAATNVTGTLPVGNGGTGSATLTANNVLLGNGTSALQAVAPSTSGNVLTSNGTTWASTAPAGGGAWTYLSTVTASSSATVDIETTIDSTYQNYAIVASSVFSATNNVTLYVRQKQSGAYTTTGYDFHLTTNNNGSATYDASVGTGAARYTLATPVSNTTNNPGGVSFIMYLPNPSNTTKHKNIFANGVNTNDVVGMHQIVFAGSASSADVSAVTGIRFFMSSGNVSSGTFRLYGIKNS